MRRLALAFFTAAPGGPDLRPIRFVAHAGRLKLGTEKQSCFPVTFPRDQATDVDHVEMFVHSIWKTSAKRPSLPKRRMGIHS